MRRALFIGIVCVIVLLGVPVGRALAIGGYSIDEWSTELTVQTNASVRVVERQTLTFSDTNAGVVWYLCKPEEGESVRIASVRVAPVDNGGTLLGDWVRLQMVDSDPDRQGRSPGDTAAASLRTTKTQPWYSYNIGDGMVRCYFPTGAVAARAAANAGASGEEPAEGAAGDEAPGVAGTAAGEELAEGAGGATPGAAGAGAGDEAPEAAGIAAGEEPAEGADGDEATGAAGAGAGEEPAEGADGSGPPGASELAAEPDASAGEGFRTYVIEADYTVAHRVRVFRDVGELYWRYAHDSLPADAARVSLQVVLPVPGDIDPAAARESVRAWGHGPDGGTFAIGDDGAVTYEVDEVTRGNYAEAHVIFPASWLTNVVAGSANQHSELRGPAAIGEESEWVDIGLREAAWDNKVRVIFLVAALLVILLGAIAVLRFGRSPRSRRALVRVAATLGIMALGANLFFREPLTTAMLALLAAIVLLTTLALPSGEVPEIVLAADGGEGSADGGGEGPVADGEGSAVARDNAAPGSAFGLEPAPEPAAVPTSEFAPATEPASELGPQVELGREPGAASELELASESGSVFASDSAPAAESASGPAPAAELDPGSEPASAAPDSEEMQP